jgi:ABC-type sugar transport system substrate-binding protein
MEKRQHRAVAGLGVIALTLAGCSGTTTAAAPSTSGTVAFSTVSTQIPVIASLSDEASKVLRKSGYDVTVQDSAFDPVKQAQQIQQALNTSAIVGAWIFPVAAESLAPTLKLLQSKHIPVVVDGTASDFGMSTPQPGIIFVASDFKKYGETIGDEAAKCATKAGATQALLLSPSDTAGQSATVNTAITAAFTAGAPNTKIVDKADGKDLPSAQAAVSRLLIAHPDASVVIASTDEATLGAVNAYAAAGKTPDCIVTGGGGPDALAARKAGKITAIVLWDYTTEAETAGADLVRLLKDPTSNGGVFATPIKIDK